MEIFIGIDQSINSTGICVKLYENNTLIKEHFYIITNKVTKKALSYSQTLDNFDYVFYDKKEKSESKNNDEFEWRKLLNNILITDNILEIIKSNILGPLDRVYIGIEGVSYQSSQTKSLLDLAGLSTLIRYRLYKFFISHQDNVGELKIFTPGEIKKFASGNGNCSKDVMVGLYKTAYKEIALLPKIDDIADAYWICTYFKELNNKACD